MHDLQLLIAFIAVVLFAIVAAAYIVSEERKSRQ